MRLAKFRGLNRKSFYLHLKECEFRFNYRDQNLYLKILTLNLSYTLIKFDERLIQILMILLNEYALEIKTTSKDSKRLHYINIVSFI